MTYSINATIIFIVLISELFASMDSPRSVESSASSPRSARSRIPLSPAKGGCIIYIANPDHPIDEKLKGQTIIRKQDGKFSYQSISGESFDQLDLSGILGSKSKEEDTIELDADQCFELTQKKIYLPSAEPCTSKYAKEKDLTTSSPLGRGAFGAVDVVCDPKADPKLRALKSIRITGINPRETLKQRVAQSPQAHEFEFITKNSKFLQQEAKFYPYERDLYLCVESDFAPLSFSKIDDIGDIDPETRKFIVQSAIQKMQSISEQDIIHRDIKPDNLVIKKDGSVDLIDFGTAIKEGESIDRGAGTSGYWAPEMRRGDSQDASKLTDSYALALSLLEKLFPKKNVLQLIEGLNGDNVEKIADLIPADIRQQIISNYLNFNEEVDKSTDPCQIKDSIKESLYINALINLDSEVFSKVFDVGNDEVPILRMLMKMMHPDPKLRTNTNQALGEIGIGEEPPAALKDTVEERYKTMEENLNC